MRAVKVGNDGKFIEASTPPASMSFTRSCDVVAAGPHLVEALRLDAVLLLGAPGDGVERRGLHHDLAEDPDVGALVVAHELRRPVLVLGVEVVGEQVGRLDEVVVDADEDEVVARVIRAP